MGQVAAARMSAQIEGDFVVFLIGMRINKWWKVPIEQSGCLETRLISPGMTVQYWRSFDHLEAFARDENGLHMPAWQRFNKAAKKARGDVGIWHETFLIEAGSYETLYSGMPQQGLGRAGRLVPATGSMNSARSRVRNAHKPDRSTMP